MLPSACALLSRSHRSFRPVSLSLSSTSGDRLAYKAFGTCCRQYIRSARVVTSGLTNCSTPLSTHAAFTGSRVRPGNGRSIHRNTQRERFFYRKYTGARAKDGGNQADASHVEEDLRGLLRDRTYDRLPGQSLRVKFSGILDILENRSFHHCKQTPAE